MTETKPRDVYRGFFSDGEVTEIRAFGLNGRGPWDGFAKGGGIVFGYFDNAEGFHKGALALEEAQAQGVYFTLNPVMPDFLGRAANRLKAAGAKDKTTSDSNIQAVRWLPVDLDPVRIGGGTDLNSSGPELAQAEQMRGDIAHWLHSEFGLPIGFVGMSGNGGHVLVRLPDLEPGEETAGLIRRALQAIGAKWTDGAVKVDQAVFNSGRIWKCYGTVSRKSDHTEARPQRRAGLELVRPLAEIPVAEIEALRALADSAPQEPEPEKRPPENPPKPSAAARGDSGGLGPLDVGKYLSDHGVDYTEKNHNSNTLFILGQCLFNPDHKGKDAAIIQEPSGKLKYRCFHESCSDRRWADAKAKISGAKSIAEWCAGYDPNWRPPERAETPKAQGRGLSVRNEEAAPPRPYLYKRGSAWGLDEAAAAEYFEALLAPIVATDAAMTRDPLFLRYEEKTGVWRNLEMPGVQRIMLEDMGKYARNGWINTVSAMLFKRTWKPIEDLKPKGMVLNLRNGMWDIEAQELFPHHPKYMSRFQMPVCFDWEKQADKWVGTLNEIFADDLDKVTVLQEFFGYCLYPKILWPGVLFAIGDGRNGKGVVEHILCKLMGEGAVSHISLARMNERFGVAELENKLVNTCGETETHLLDVSRFKQVSAGDAVQAEVKYVADRTFTPVAKHFISMNYWPRVAEKTASFFRRLTILEFNQRFDEGTADPGLKWDLEAELDGILMWALEGLYSILKQKGFTETDSTRSAKERYREANNPFLTFIAEECVLAEGAKIPKKELFQKYREWAVDSGLKPLSKAKLYEQVKLNCEGVAEKKPKYEERIFVGIGLSAENWG